MTDLVTGLGVGHGSLLVLTGSSKYWGEYLADIGRYSAGCRGCSVGNTDTLVDWLGDSWTL